MDAPFTSAICIATALVTLIAFQRVHLRDRLLFQTNSILVLKQWYRLFSSALIHADFAHLAFNLITIYSFGGAIEQVFGPVTLLAVYALSVLGGSLLSLYVHRHHDYAALGASGGGCGVLFAAIFLVPGTGVSVYFLPIYLPGPLYAVLFLVGTFWAMRRRQDNIGHDAHLGGAIVGLLAALVVAPRNCFASSLLFASCAVFSAVSLVLMFKGPHRPRGWLKHFSREPEYKPSVRYQDYDHVRRRRQQEEEVDRILEKISREGTQSLSTREKAVLQEASSKLARRG